MKTQIDFRLEHMSLRSPYHNSSLYEFTASNVVHHMTPSKTDETVVCTTSNLQLIETTAYPDQGQNCYGFSYPPSSAPVYCVTGNVPTVVSASCELRQRRLHAEESAGGTETSATPKCDAQLTYRLDEGKRKENCSNDEFTPGQHSNQQRR